MRAARVAAVVLLAVLLGAARCDDPAGEVTDRAKGCQQARDGAEVCTYKLRTTRWFETVRSTYDRCQVGEQYPACRTD